MYQAALSDFDPGVPLTMFEKLDVNTSNFPTCYGLRDYVEDNAISYEEIFASLAKLLFS